MVPEGAACILPPVKHFSYIMVWRAITKYEVGSISILEGAINAAAYKEIVEYFVVPVKTHSKCNFSGRC